MSKYLETIYFTDEYSPDKYPQKFCDHLVKKYFISKDNSKAKLLDIGSGKGNHLVGFSRNNLIVKGLDLRNECINALPDYDIRECNLEKDPFPFEDNTFDFVFSKSVLEHVYNTENIIKETFRVLKPGGKTVQLTPDWATDYKIFWDDPTHVKPFTRKGLQDAFKFEGFEKVACEGFWQLPFLWEFPHLEFFRFFLSLLPNSLKWKDKEELIQRPLIRHSKECMLIVIASKPNN